MAKNDPIPIDDQSLFFSQIVDSYPALLHTARPDGYFDFFNQTWLDFTGESLEKLRGLGWTSSIHPEDVEVFVRNMRESFAMGKPFQVTSRVRRADGVYRWMLHLKVPAFDRDGNIVKWFGSSIDIDDGKRAEKQLVRRVHELQRSEFYLAEAQRLGHIGSWVLTPRLDSSTGPVSFFKYMALTQLKDRPTPRNTWQSYIHRIANSWLRS
jgi:PAS domain S-box-containing protein